jgi:5-methylcytosine-specific restriction endonuclease McrA
MKSENEQKRKKIPTSVRNRLWRRYYPESINGKCYVCKTDITIDNFHAGHILSVRNGGSDNIENLKITCSLCNLSMGIQNLEEFKIKYF